MYDISTVLQIDSLCVSRDDAAMQTISYIKIGIFWVDNTMNDGHQKRT
jgi:hypothetical protein